MSVRNSLLAILASRPAHGYGLKSSFEDSTAGRWPLNVGQVYTTLQRLERDGLAEPTSGDETSDDRQEWRITAPGRDLLRDWYQTPVANHAQRDELTLKVLLALATDAPELDAILDTQRTASMQLLQDYTRDKQQADPTRDLPWLLLLDALILKTQAELEWLELCRKRLSQQRGSQA